MANATLRYQKFRRFRRKKFRSMANATLRYQKFRSSEVQKKKEEEEE
jgi:hypothetical protein